MLALGGLTAGVPVTELLSNPADGLLPPRTSVAAAGCPVPRALFLPVV